MMPIDSSCNESLILPPGFRFHPTDEELIVHYLRRRASSSSSSPPASSASVIADVDIYKFDPWDLPAKANYGDREWYFYSPRDRKYPNGFRPNRAAASGYWKATGADKPILIKDEKEEKKMIDVRIGVRKALVFYKGRPPMGEKTDWIMHEYRLVDGDAVALPSHSTSKLINQSSSMRLDDWVLCRIYWKNSSTISSLIMDDQHHHQQQQHESSPPLPNNMIISIEDYTPAVFPNLQFGHNPSSCPMPPPRSSQSIHFNDGISSAITSLLDTPRDDDGLNKQHNYSLSDINLPYYWEQEFDSNLLLDQQHLFM